MMEQDVACTVAIIPARGGSKGLPRKNILNLAGKPVIGYTIEAALQSAIFQQVVVSTDDEEIADAARLYGADILMRPGELAEDHTGMYAVVDHALRQIDPQGQVQCFALLQPTSPLRTANHIRQAYEMMLSHWEGCDMVVSVALAEHPRNLVHPLDERGTLANFVGDFAHYSRQTHAQCYTPNGAIFLAKPEAYRLRQHFFGERSLAYVMDRHSSVDIDDEIDFLLAQVLMERQR